MGGNMHYKSESLYLIQSKYALIFAEECIKELDYKGYCENMQAHRVALAKHKTVNN